MYVWVAKIVHFSEISLGVLHQADEIAVETETGVPHTQLNILEADAVPWVSGIALLLGMGGVYLFAKRRKEE